MARIRDFDRRVLYRVLHQSYRSTGTIIASSKTACGNLLSSCRDGSFFKIGENRSAPLTIKINSN